MYSFLVLRHRLASLGGPSAVFLATRKMELPVPQQSMTSSRGPISRSSLGLWQLCIRSLTFRRCRTQGVGITATWTINWIPQTLYHIKSFRGHQG
jgi:hypothetical protein